MISRGPRRGTGCTSCACRLPNSGIRKLTVAASAATQNVKARMGLPHHGVSQAELDYRMGQARRIEDMIPRTFAAQRASVAQQVWLDYHLQYRGLDATAYSREDMETILPVRHIGEPVIDEGGKSDEQTKAAKLNPFTHRYLKVGDEEAFSQGLASYQSMFAVTELPAGGLIWPGSSSWATSIPTCPARTG